MRLGEKQGQSLESDRPLVAAVDKTERVRKVPAVGRQDPAGGGAQPVGIDIQTNAGERFESHEMDLSDPKALERFPDESFDHANNYFLTVPKNSMHARCGTSPSIWLSLGWKHKDDNYNLAKERGIPLKDLPEFYQRQNWKRMWAIDDGIFLRVQRLLKEGGVYTLAEFAYRKKKGSSCGRSRSRCHSGRNLCHDHAADEAQGRQRNPSVKYLRHRRELLDTDFLECGTDLLRSGRLFEEIGEAERSPELMNCSMESRTRLGFTPAAATMS